MPAALSLTLRLASLCLLVAGIGLAMVGFGARFYGQVGDPNDDFLKMAAYGIAGIIIAVVLDRFVATKERAKDDSRGFEVLESGPGKRRKTS